MISCYSHIDILNAILIVILVIGNSIRIIFILYLL